MVSRLAYVTFVSTPYFSRAGVTFEYLAGIGASIAISEAVGYGMCAWTFASTGWVYVTAKPVITPVANDSRILDSNYKATLLLIAVSYLLRKFFAFAPICSYGTLAFIS